MRDSSPAYSRPFPPRVLKRTGQGLQGLVRSGQRLKNPEQSQYPGNSLLPPPATQLAVGVVSAVEIFCFWGLVDRTWARTDIKPPIRSPQRPQRAPRAFMRTESGFAGIGQKRTEIEKPGAISIPR
jgi:hypothetical protein